MRRKTGLKRTPMRRKMPRRGNIPMEARLAVMERSGGVCEGAIPGVCTGRAQEWHHRRSRAVGENPHSPANGAALCSACHHHITHVSPAVGLERGLIVRRNTDVDPADVPMLLCGKTWVHLDENGGWHA